MLAGLLYHTACLLYILLYRSVLSLEDDSGGRKYGECIGIRLSQFDDHIQIMVAADLVAWSRMIHRIPVINIVVAGKISRFVQIDRQRVLRGMIYGAVDGDDCICTGASGKEVPLPPNCQMHWTIGAKSGKMVAPVASSCVTHTLVDWEL